MFYRRISTTRRGVQKQIDWRGRIANTFALILLIGVVVTMMSGCTTLKKWAEILEPADGVDVGNPIVVQPTPSPSDPFFADLVWLRSNGSSAKVTITLHEFNIVSSNFMTFRADNVGHWPHKINGKDKTALHGEVCLAVLRDGKWTGGKFDHTRADTRSRDFENVTGRHNGYLPISPQRGDTVRFWLLSYDGKQASNYLESVWK